MLLSHPGTLELKSEQTNAHSDTIFSVAFSPDGTKIVSGSRDETIKVWDAGAISAQNRLCVAPMLTTTPDRTIIADSLALVTQKENAHGRTISSVDYNHDGTKIVSACYGGTIKVWDSGAFWASNRPSLAITDDVWLP